MGSSQKLILFQVSGALDKVSGDNDEVSGLDLMKNEDVAGGFSDEASGVYNEEIEGAINEISEVDLVKNEDIVVGFSDDVSRVYNEDVEGGINEVSGVDWVKNEDIVVGFSDEVSRVYNEDVEGGMNEVSGVDWVKNEDIVVGFSDEVSRVYNEEFKGDFNGVSAPELVKTCDKIGLGFDVGVLKNDSDVNFDRKGVVSVMGGANSSLQLMSKKLAYPLKMELIDETVLIEFSGFGRRGGEKGGSNGDGVGVAKNSNGGNRKMKYSRRELEKLRFVDVQGQKKFWQDVYYGFADNVRKEYSELGNFSRYKQIGPYNCYNGMKNYQGIPGMAAGRGRCTYPNIYVYRRNGIINF